MLSNRRIQKAGLLLVLGILLVAGLRPFNFLPANRAERTGDGGLLFRGQGYSLADFPLFDPAPPFSLEILLTPSLEPD